MASFTDDFTRANSATLGANWTEGQGISTGTGGTIASNLLRNATVSSTGAARWNTVLDTDDHYCQLQMVTAWAASKVMYLAVRAESDGRPNVYAAMTGGGTWTVNVMDNAGTTSQKSTGSFTPAAGGTYRLEAQGNIYTLKQNGTSIGTWNDSGGTYVTSSLRRYVCIGIFSSSGNIDADNFAAADIAGAVNTGQFFAMF